MRKNTTILRIGATIAAFWLHGCAGEAERPPDQDAEPPMEKAVGQRKPPRLDLECADLVSEAGLSAATGISGVTYRKQAPKVNGGEYDCDFEFETVIDGSNFDQNPPYVNGSITLHLGSAGTDPSGLCAAGPGEEERTGFRRIDLGAGGYLFELESPVPGHGWRQLFFLDGEAEACVQLNLQMSAADDVEESILKIARAVEDSLD